MIELKGKHTVGISVDFDTLDKDILEVIKCRNALYEAVCKMSNSLYDGELLILETKKCAPPETGRENK